MFKMFKRKKQDDFDTVEFDKSKNPEKEIEEEFEEEESEENEKEPEEEEEEEEPSRKVRKTPKKVVRKNVEPLKRKVYVVKELPTQITREVLLEDGTKAKLITVEEALERILAKLNQL